MNRGSRNRRPVPDSPCPRHPRASCPKAATRASSVTSTVCAAPAATSSTAFWSCPPRLSPPRSDTRPPPPRPTPRRSVKRVSVAGMRRSDASPKPSWPRAFEPSINTRPRWRRCRGRTRSIEVEVSSRMAQCASPPPIFTTRAPSGMSSSEGSTHPRRWGGTRSSSADGPASAATSSRFARKSAGTDAFASVAVARLASEGRTVAARAGVTAEAFPGLAPTPGSPGGTSETPGTPSGSSAPGPKTADKIPPTRLRPRASSSSSWSSSTVRGFRLLSSPYRKRLWFSFSLVSLSVSSRSSSNASGSP